MLCLPNKLAHGDRLDPPEAGECPHSQTAGWSIFASVRVIPGSISGVHTGLQSSPSSNAANCAAAFAGTERNEPDAAFINAQAMLLRAGNPNLIGKSDFDL
jgi:hypothetical protein